MDHQYSSMRELYNEVQQRFTEALVAIHRSNRAPDVRLRLLQKLQNEYGAAGTAEGQLAAIREVMRELEG